jgi:phosphoserine phosphatase
MNAPGQWACRLHSLDAAMRAVALQLVCAISACVATVGCDASGASSKAAITATSAPLSSWRDGVAREAILNFIKGVTTPGPEFVGPSDRIAVFDNDGTLWTEQPTYNQMAFAIARAHALGASHPEYRELVAAHDEQSVAKLVAATHTGMTSDEFSRIVRTWIESARHPVTGRLYTDMVYQPMLELLSLLRENGFAVYIVSGGGVEFIRPWAERVYGIPPDHVVGSRTKLKYERRDGVPVLVRLPEIEFVDDGPGKPVGIQEQIGKRPIAAFGNSDGDFEMLEWTTSGPGRRLGVLVHHTDAEREWAYDRGSKVGKLERALEAAPSRGWIVVDMKNDWSRIYPTSN